MAHAGRALAIGLLALGAVSCGSASTSDGAAGGPPTAAVATSEPGAEVSSEGVFLATVSELTAGTDYEGLAEADPQGFLATADSMCDLLDAGETVEDVLRAYLTELGQVRTPLGPDDADLAGSLLGAAVTAFCPQHTDALPDR